MAWVAVGRGVWVSGLDAGLGVGTGVSVGISVVVARATLVGAGVVVGAAAGVAWDVGVGRGVRAVTGVAVDIRRAAGAGGGTVGVGCGAAQATTNKQTTRPGSHCFLMVTLTTLPEGAITCIIIITLKNMFFKIEMGDRYTFGTTAWLGVAGQSRAQPLHI